VRSLYARIFVPFLATLIFSFLGFIAVTNALYGRARTVLEHAYARELEEAVKVYETGGTEELSRFLRKLDVAFQTVHHVLDSSGNVLATTQQRPYLLSTESDLAGHIGRGQTRWIQTSADGRYRLVALSTPTLQVASYLPFYGLILAAVAFPCWFIVVGVVVPLRALVVTVDDFGKGNLGARAQYRGNNEIGRLASSFNAMADRLESVRLAERRLLQDISHELRSPLARLEFAAELSRTASDRNAAADRMMREVRRLSQLVGEVLDMTRLEHAPAVRTAEDIDVSRLLREVGSYCALEAERRGCELVAEPTACCVVRGDPELLRRAIENVVRNAIEHTHPGTSIQIALRARNQSAVIAVRDKGPGVPPELLPRIFEPFFRIDAARHLGHGAGLGLSIAERAVRAHGGSILAENARPGLRVTITIPCSPVARDTDARAQLGTDSPARIAEDIARA